MTKWIGALRKHQAPEQEPEPAPPAEPETFGSVLGKMMSQHTGNEAPAAQAALYKATRAGRIPGRDPVSGRFIVRDPPPDDRSG
jgi:hypothetical protein